ncbi:MULTISPECIES: M48 family metallopeptidase [Nitrospirillum]|uniref:STE24 endopeptidase n=1 Tax=Nitrospirillum amazonense TaxID=28077 RepID=A0A560FIS1_9PROT|nr:M48 family metallopeptidase [Nitrospirillum amazonense]MEC4595064.1 M48 family metallopeptidase [Nitrospirillum amazonense]TWB21494.1 STE24 endopeptidase [Nitrospirillum amazonense]
MKVWGQGMGAAVAVGILGAALGACLVPVAANAAAFDPVAATQAYLDTVPADARAKSNAYFEGGYWLQLWRFLVSLAVAAVFLAGGLARRLRDRLAGLGRFATPVFFIAYTVIDYVLSLPYVAYADWYRERQYGLMNQTFGDWFGDQMIQLAISSLIGALVVWVLYAIVRRLGRSWWIWASAFGVVVLVLMIVVTPVFVAPLFNKYEPMKQGPVREALLSMARSNEVPATDVYEFNASRQSNKISANVSGLFGTTRISLTDTLLQRCTLAEIKAVMGHEMGHYVLNHVFVLLLYLSLLVCLGYLFVDRVFGRLTRGGRWGITGLGDVAGLPLVVILFTAYFFVLTPVLNTIIRTQEAEADAFGLNLSREPDGFATVALKLAEYRKLQPGRWEEIVFYDHPSGYNRILRAMRWKAENLPAVAAAPAEPAPGPAPAEPKP